NCRKSESGNRAISDLCRSVAMGQPKKSWASRFRLALLKLTAQTALSESRIGGDGLAFRRANTGYVVVTGLRIESGVVTLGNIVEIGVTGTGKCCIDVFVHPSETAAFDLINL